MRLRLMIATTGSLLCVLIAGCGSNPATGSGSNTAPAASTLAGNWLLGPSLPTLSLPAVSTGSVTFDVSGQTVTALGSFEAACSGGPYLVQFGGVATGTVQADGAFSLTFEAAATPPSGAAAPTVTLSGKVPSMAGGPWPGSYTMSSTSGLGCTAAQLTNSFNATPLGDYTGLYTGSGTYQVLFNSMASSGTVVLSLTLQQGAPLGNSTTVSQLGLSGSLNVTGIPCFTKSVGTPALNHSLAAGSRAVLSLTMDDGSTADLLFSASNVSLSSLALQGLSVSSGKCAGQYLFFPNQVVLTRQ